MNNHYKYKCKEDHERPVKILDALPSWEQYCTNTTAVNALAFSLNDGGMKVWFSYRTPIAFRAAWGEPIIVRANQWGPTTGKHINAIDDGDKSNRIDGAKFEVLLSTTLGIEGGQQ